MWAYAAWLATAGYGAYVMGRELWERLDRLYGNARLTGGTGVPGGPGGEPGSVDGRVTDREAAWLAGWVLCCAVWAALLWATAAFIHSGHPVAKALFL